MKLYPVLRTSPAANQLYLYLFCAFLAAGAVSCSKSGNKTDAPAGPPVQAADSVLLSYPDGQQWKAAYGYRLSHDKAAHVYTVEETDFTFAPLPLAKVVKRFYFSADEKQLSRIFMQHYAIHTGVGAIPVSSMALNFVPDISSLSPAALTVQSYTDIDGQVPYALESFPLYNTDPALARPFDVRSSMRVPVLPLRNDIMEYLLQYRRDSLLSVQGDFDLKAAYFSTIAPGYAGLDAYFNTFSLTRDSTCSQYVFDKTWREVVSNGNSGYYIYHPVARKKTDFRYDDHSRALAATFNSMDPGWFSPFKTMLTEYTMDYTLPKMSTRTFFENTCSGYTDSVFTFNTAGQKAFYSAVTWTNIVTTDAQGRITSLTHQPNAGTEQAVRYTFFYNN